MTYVLGAIVILLLIALILVFRPPKRRSYDNYERQDPEIPVVGPSGGETTHDDIVTEADEEELNLLFADSGENDPDQGEDIEELVLDLDEEGTEGCEGEYSDADSDEFDELIPCIEGDENIGERKGEVAPALADIPDDFKQFEEDETPDELAERLEYFLGSDEQVEEFEQEAAESTIGSGEDTAVIEKEIETTDGAVEIPQAEEEREQVETGPDAYLADLKEMEENFRRDLNEAIKNHETVATAALEVVLEDICARQIDIQTSFQAQQKLQEELYRDMKEVQKELPGFQLEVVQESLAKREYEVAQNMLVEAASQLTGSSRLASATLYHLGRIMEERGLLTEALGIFNRAIDCDGRSLDSLFSAGRLSRVTGDMEKARSLLERRVQAAQESGEDTIEFARAEQELARVLLAADEKDRVELLLEHARETIEKICGPGHHDLGPVLQDLALMKDSGGRYEEAEPLYTKAVEVTEQGLGSDHPRLGAMLNKLAGLYEELEMEKKAEPLYARALEIKQRVLGENHPDVGAIMGQLANQLKMKGRFDQAEPMYRKSLEIAETALGKDHPNLAVVLNDIAELYGEMGNEEQAEYFQERAFSLFGLPGMGDGFVEMDKDNNIDDSDDADKKVTES